LNNLQKVQLE